MSELLADSKGLIAGTQDGRYIFCFGEFLNMLSKTDAETVDVIKNPEKEIYQEALTELLGQPEEQAAAESETGSTWTAWNKDNK